MKIDRILLYILIGAAGYVGFRTFGRIQATGEKAGQALAQTLYDLLHPNETRAITGGGGGENALRAINGTAASVDYSSATGREELRLYDWTAGAMQAVPTIAPPANWRDAPKVLPGFPALRAAGKPWFTPWEPSGRGLVVTFQAR